MHDARAARGDPDPTNQRRTEILQYRLPPPIHAYVYLQFQQKILSSSIALPRWTHKRESVFITQRIKRKTFIREKPFSCEIAECTRKCIIICRVCTMLIWMPVFASSRITKTARKSHHPKPTRNPLVSSEEEPSNQIYAIYSATHQQLVFRQ